MDKPLWRTAREAGDGALLLEFGDELDPTVNRRVHAVGTAIRKAGVLGVWGIIPAYTTLLIEFEPRITQASDILEHLSSLDIAEHSRETKLYEIPVHYGGEHGPDLASVAETLRLSPEEVIKIHSQSPYLIYCLGFSPGFPLCGILPESLRVPRRNSPRTQVPAGSVATAGAQTGIYPTPSPGGWNILGQTPVTLFQFDRDPPVLYQPGDYLKFRPISAEEFDDLRSMDEQGRYRLREVPYGPH